MSGCGVRRRPRGFRTNRRPGSTAWRSALDIANRVAERWADRVEPLALIDNALGPLASRETRQAVARAESRQQGLTLLLMAPEFQRR